MRIPITQIDTTQIPRDRTIVTREATEELQNSILKNGLRTPIEVYQTDTGYALISGFRRLTAHEHLTEQGLKGFDTIEATLRYPRSPQQAAAMMVEENEIRQNLSAWEKSNIVIEATERGLFDTYDAAIDGLYPNANRQKRARLRSIANVVERFDGLLTDPELLSQQKLLRLANALTHDWGNLIETVLMENRRATPAEQWKKITPLIKELETLDAGGHDTHPNRPKREIGPRKGIHIRRERTDKGYTFYITGPDADSLMTRDLLDEIERWFQ
ncbi:MAG: ParB/RepB/Spo0J family partition protein [Pseudomonadota bacterium]